MIPGHTSVFNAIKTSSLPRLHATYFTVKIFNYHCRRTANNLLFAGPCANFEETRRAFFNQLVYAGSRFGETATSSVSPATLQADRAGRKDCLRTNLRGHSILPPVASLDIYTLSLNSFLHLGMTRNAY